MAEQTGRLEWSLSGATLRKFLSASNGEEFASDLFSVGSFTFQCKAYPNGRKKEQTGSVMLYFVLQTPLANKIGKLTVKARLYCPQTLCDWKHIQHLKKDNAGIGWHSNNMLLSELAQEATQVTFLCEMSVLRIEYKATSAMMMMGSGGGGGNVAADMYHKPLTMDVYTRHEWSVSATLLQSFEASHNGKFYHSPDYNHGCWCTSIAPNGANHKDEGNAKVGLQLLQLPPGVGKIKCKFSITANHDNIHCDGKKDFSYNSPFIAWGDGTMKTSGLRQLSSALQFAVEIVIVKVYDECGAEIGRADWTQFGIVHNHNPLVAMEDAVAVALPPLSTDVTFISKDFSKETSDADYEHDAANYHNVMTPATPATPVTPVTPQSHTNHNHNNNNSNKCKSKSNTLTSSLSATPSQFVTTNNAALSHSENNSHATMDDKDLQLITGHPHHHEKCNTGLSRHTTSSQPDTRRDRDPRPTHRKTATGTGADLLSLGNGSLDFTCVHALGGKVQEVQSKLVEQELSRAQHARRLSSMEKTLRSVHASTTDVQQQHYEQTAMLKQFIGDMSSTMQRLTSEISFMQNKMKKMDSEMQLQSAKLTLVESSGSSGTGAAASPKGRRHSARLNHHSKTKDKYARQTQIHKKRNDSETSEDFEAPRVTPTTTTMNQQPRALSPLMASWIKHDCGLPQYMCVFAENGYDSIDIVKEMTKAELDEIGITLKGHQFKIMKEVEKLQQYRKHIRNDEHKMDILHVANYLTPVTSPAVSEAPTMHTATTVHAQQQPGLLHASPNKLMIQIDRNASSGYSQHGAYQSHPLPMHDQDSTSSTNTGLSSIMRHVPHPFGNVPIPETHAHGDSLHSNGNGIGNGPPISRNQNQSHPHSLPQHLQQQQQQQQQQHVQRQLHQQQFHQQQQQQPPALTEHKEQEMLDYDDDGQATPTSRQSSSGSMSATSYATTATNTTMGYLQYPYLQGNNHNQNTAGGKIGHQVGASSLLMDTPTKQSHHFLTQSLFQQQQQPAFRTVRGKTMWECANCHKSNSGSQEKCGYCTANRID